jgi:hypothetical protein
VLLHDLDFSDLSACTFWIDPQQPLATYSMRAVPTKAWSNATLSVYAATVDDLWATLLDNVSMRKTPGAATSGTDCGEPGSPLSLAAAAMGGTDANSSAAAAAAASAPVSAASSAWHSASGWASAMVGETGAAIWTVVGADTTRSVLTSPAAIDLRGAASGHLRFESLLRANRSTASIQVSVDGQNWQNVGVVPASGDWLTVDLDLTAFAGQVVWVRFVFDSVVPDPGADPDTWQIRNVIIGPSTPRLLRAEEAR